MSLTFLHRGALHTTVRHDNAHSQTELAGQHTGHNRKATVHIAMRRGFSSCTQLHAAQHSAVQHHRAVFCTALSTTLHCTTTYISTLQSTAVQSCTVLWRTVGHLHAFQLCASFTCPCRTTHNATPRRTVPDSTTSASSHHIATERKARTRGSSRSDPAIRMTIRAQPNPPRGPGPVLSPPPSPPRPSPWPHSCPPLPFPNHVPLPTHMA